MTSFPHLCHLRAEQKTRGHNTLVESWWKGQQNRVCPDSISIPPRLEMFSPTRLAQQRMFFLLGIGILPGFFLHKPVARTTFAAVEQDSPRKNYTCDVRPQQWPNHTKPHRHTLRVPPIVCWLRGWRKNMYIEGTQKNTLLVEIRINARFLYCLRKLVHQDSDSITLLVTLICMFLSGRGKFYPTGLNDTQKMKINNFILGPLPRFLKTNFLIASLTKKKNKNK